MTRFKMLLCDGFLHYARFDDSDIVLLVDNATQTMQAAPVVLMKSLAAAGKTSKLMICFTHMDQVKGDNIPTFALKKQHVLASGENVLTSIGEQLGKGHEKSTGFGICSVHRGLPRGRGRWAQ